MDCLVPVPDTLSSATCVIESAQNSTGGELEGLLVALAMPSELDELRQLQRPKGH